MNIEEIQAYCLSKEQVEETLPFGPDTLVMKVRGKMFLLAGLDDIPLQINLKGDPENNIVLRAHYSCVIPGYHMNKTHWNTVVCDGSVPDSLIREWIDTSYDLVVKGLPKKVKDRVKKKKGRT